MVALVVSDNADGTGGVGVISGAGGGSTVRLYRSAFTGTLGAHAWTLTASRVGNGNVTFDPGDGYYLWQAVEDTGVTLVPSNAYLQNLTDATTNSVLYRILDAFLVRLRLLALSGIADAKIQAKWVFRLLDNVEPAPPCVIVAPYSSLGYPGKLTGTDDIEYLIAVALVDKQNQDSVANMARDTLWHQRVSRAFRSQPLPGVTEAYRIDHAPQPVVDPALWQKNYLVMPMGFKVTARETRGLS